MALVKYTAVKLLHKSNVWVPTDISESVVPLLAPCIYMPNSGTNVAEMFAFTLISKDSLPQKTPVLNSQLIHQETIMTV
jgi:peptidyl-tRNA hydrolase